MIHLEDTICAPATPVGSGAITVIRISGPEALAICDKVVSFKTGAALSSEGYTLKYGEIPGVDQVIAGIFRAPHSYTGEDSVEISCHASRFIAEKILSLLCDAGARLAEPGEFSRRAFLNGKMDLAQAEAVADLISADTEASHRIAINQLRGKYSGKLRDLRDKLLEIASLMELELDFSEEEVEFADRDKLRTLLDDASSEISRLADSFKLGNAIKNGVPVAIAGAVNAGKSTLLNALLGEDRAIVSDIPGTTRDTVEETLTLGGILFRFIDTAGLRDSSDAIEKIGIERSYASLAKADVVIGVLDALSPLEESGKALADIASRLSPSSTVILVRNKVDAFDAIAPEEFPTLDRSYGVLPLKYPAFGTYELAPQALTEKLAAILEDRLPASSGWHIPKDYCILDISARTGEGLDELRARLAESRGILVSDNNATLVTNLRHYEALRAALEDLHRVRSGLSAGTTGDLLAQDLRSAIYSLNSIFGEVSTEDILKRIFERFCIGK